jgi:transposase
LPVLTRTTPTKKRQERLIEKAHEREGWAVGFQDEVWWSRLTTPNLHSWVEDAPLKLVEQAHEKDDPDPKALACYGIDLRYQKAEEVWIRFVEGNPRSDPTIDFMKWVLEKTAEQGIRVLLMFWDHASWHKSKKVRSWLYRHNQEVKRTGEGTRLLAVFLPKKSPWLNPIEPRWLHAKRKVVEPGRKLSALELSERVSAVFDQPVLPWITNSKSVS